MVEIHIQAIDYVQVALELLLFKTKIVVRERLGGGENGGENERRIGEDKGGLGRMREVGMMREVGRLRRVRKNYNKVKTKIKIKKRKREKEREMGRGVHTRLINAIIIFICNKIRFEFSESHSI